MFCAWIPAARDRMQALVALLCLLKMSSVTAQARYSVPEEQSEGSFVGNIARDLGLDLQRLVGGNARIITKDSQQYVDLNREKGILVIKERIDREELCGKTTPCSFSFEQKPPNNDWRFTQGQRPGPSGPHMPYGTHIRWTPKNGTRATGGPEVAMGTGPWPQPPTEAEQLQALMAAANEVSEATATLGPGTMGLSTRYSPQFTLQHVPDYRQNVYIPGSTATLTSNPQQQQATAQQATQQALPPPQASAQAEPPKAAQTPASKKKSTKKEKK
ncbi:protocadherin gamma-A1-like isoform X50 [Xiphophorus maculatus]|uniref:protocadherin gamma-A1-like isoform X50 n=1 Tax=Xiphophorus maculatus TaxID=8083 RepID=UPI000C6EC648|nr:protocadherin gamma-A1-like isoform X50 [Xiphophorus maculatus]